MKYFTILVLSISLMGTGFLFSQELDQNQNQNWDQNPSQQMQEPVRRVCHCKNCRCTFTSHCGCFSDKGCNCDKGNGSCCADGGCIRR